MTLPDLRKLRAQTYAVDWTPFSLWCWEGICKTFVGPSVAVCLVECSCSCHGATNPARAPVASRS